MPTDICEAKRMLRKEILSKRRHLGEEICQTFGRQFAERIVGLDEYKAADTILCYASCKGEADTWKLIEKALEDGKRVALPRVTGPAEMHFYKITSMKDVAPGYYDISFHVSTVLDNAGYMQVTPFYNGSPHLEYGIYFKTNGDLSSAYGSNAIIIYVPTQTSFTLTYNSNVENRSGAATVAVIKLNRNV